MADASDPASAGLLNLEKELVCFICTEVLYKPLTLIDCLHTFCGFCLKEWFALQHKKACQSSSSSSTTNPYTCPTCRASVKDARHNATVTTLLDMFLKANPSKGRTKEEMEEMSQAYKPGENILPKVESQRRRERRARREEEEAGAYERRTAEEARERIIREAQPRPERSGERLTTPGEIANAHSRSREREERRDRRREQERADRRSRAEAAEAALAQEQSSTIAQVFALSPPTTSPRHPDAVEARQRERIVEHQSSLRSMVSASESGTGTGDSLSEARIMQEILAEGLLDGINIDELTEAEQDQLSERIAEAYRQRHLPRNQTSPPQSRPPVPAAPAVPASANPPDQGTSLIPQGAERRHRHRSRSSQRSNNEQTRPTADGSDPPNPAIRQRNLEPTDNLSPPTTTRANPNRRRTSDQNRPHASPSPSPRRTTVSAVSSQNSANRPATDVPPVPRRTGTPPQDRVRRISDDRRSNTEPVQSSPSVSEIWRQGGVEHPRAQTMRAETPSHTPPRSGSPRPATANVRSTTEQLATRTRPAPHERRSEPPPAQATLNPQPAVPTVKTASVFDEPSVSCAHCNRPNIQYEVYKHCAPCEMDICRRCYRSGRGCDHWFGFGKAAMAKFESSAPARTSRLLDLPHVLVGRQYIQPPGGSVTAYETDHATKTTRVGASTSNPLDRLQEGHFCDRCGAFANACFWSCEYCNDGEWGFCNSCVDTHHCCTHPLLPIAHPLFAPASPLSQPPADYDIRKPVLAAPANDTPSHSRPSTSQSFTTQPKDTQADYIPLSITAHCDICSQPIPNANARYHCPFHLSNHPSEVEQHNLGGFDVCTSCYHSLSRSGRIKRENAANGWRKCLDGHRMIVIGFETHALGTQRRIVIHDLVGGWKITDEEIAGWASSASNNQTSSVPDPATGKPQSSPNSPPLPATVASVAPGKWTWREDAAGSRIVSRARASTLTSLAHMTTSSTSSFPPNGGFGKRCVALWSYYPDEGEEGKGELMFPKHAEVTEVEEINDEWWYGVYAGLKGVFPAVFVRAIRG